MKGIIRHIDRFCFKHPRFGIQNLMICVVVGTILSYILSLMGGIGRTFESYLYFDAAKILRGEIWRLITFIFINQFDTPIFLVISLYFYYFVGSTLERQWGSAKFTVYYLSGMLFLIIFGFVTYFFGYNISELVTANYLNLGMFFVFATFFPDLRVMLFFIVPVKVKIIALADLLYFVVIILATHFPERLLPVVCLLHYFVFCGGWLIDYLRPSSERSKRKKNKVNFRREVSRLKHGENLKNYTRRCEICGKTDTDYPNLEFRYCSRCEGYHCYCEEHISDHTHK